MQKQITVTVRREEKQIVNIEFPIYRKNDINDGSSTWTTIRRIDANEKFVSVAKHERISWLNSSEISYELEFGRLDLANESADYILGNSATISSADEFNAMLSEMKKVIDKLTQEK